MTNRQYERLRQKSEHVARQRFYLNEWSCAMREFDRETHSDSKPVVTRLRHCTAWVFETDNWYILRTYSTYIAAIRKTTGDCFDALRHVYGYTSTSAQHVAKFRHDYGAKTYCRIDGGMCR